MLNDHDLQLYNADTLDDVIFLVRSNLHLILGLLNSSYFAECLFSVHIGYISEAPGVVLLLLSLVMTRGIDVVRKEYSEQTGLLSLIGDDACCEQVLADIDT